MRAEMLIRPGDEMPAKTIGVLLDITSRKEAEETLKEREAELRSALEAGSLAIFDFDHARGEMKPSARLSELYGYPPDHVLSISDIRARYHPEDVERIWSKRDGDHGDASVRYFDWTLRLLLPDGAIRWVNGRGEYLRDETGRIRRSRGVIMDITERKRWEEHQQVLINELNHRVKNTLATVQSIASQTLRNTPSIAAARPALEERLFALSRAHDVLTRENWEGAGLIEIVREALAPYRHERENRLHLEGPDVRLSPRMALATAMTLQELATNAVRRPVQCKRTGPYRLEGHAGEWGAAPPPDLERERRPACGASPAPGLRNPAHRAQPRSGSERDRRDHVRADGGSLHGQRPLDRNGSLRLCQGPAGGQFLSLEAVDHGLDPVDDRGGRGAHCGQGHVEQPIAGDDDHRHENPAEDLLEPDAPAATPVALFAPGHLRRSGW